MYPGPNTLLRRGLNVKGQIATVMHEAMHHVGFSSEGDAWMPVDKKCLGRYAEKPKVVTGTTGGGGGGGGGGEGPPTSTFLDGQWWCEYELQWDCWEDDGETVCGNFRWVRTNAPCEYVVSG